MDVFIIHTANPFGHLMYFGSIVVLGVIGLTALMSGIRRRRAWRSLTGGTLLAFSAFVIWLNITFDAALDLNPIIKNEAVLIGTWEGENSRLELHGNRTFTCHGESSCNPVGQSGTWDFYNFSMGFSQEGKAPKSLRVISYVDKYCLIDMPDDPDLWNGIRLFCSPKLVS